MINLDSDDATTYNATYPNSVSKPLLSQMSVTIGEDRHYWHVVIQRKSGRIVLRLLGATDGPKLTTFLVPKDSAPVA